MKKLRIFLALVALIAGPAAAGVVYEIEVTDHQQSPPQSESIQVAVEGANLKIGIASGGSRAKSRVRCLRCRRRSRTCPKNSER